MRPRVLLYAVVACAAASPARAAFTTVDISSYLNGNVSINPQTDPVGFGYGNRGTNIPFQTYAHGTNSYMGSAFLAGQSPSPGTSTTLTIGLTSLNIQGQASFYALLNNYYGTPNVNEYNVIINFVGGAQESYQSIGGVDTRDYNENPGTDNTIANTTHEWWANGTGTNYQRLDVREFSIASTYQSDQIASFEIQQVDSSDPAFLSGLTFSTNAAQSLSVPEPASIALLATGILLIGVTRLRKPRLR